MGFAYVQFMAELMRPRVYPPQPEMPPPPLTPLRKPVGESTVGVFVSAGLRHRDDAPLGETNDLSYRLVHRDLPLSDLVIDHMTPVRKWALEDVNVAYPRDHLVKLEAQGVIGRLADEAVSMVGTIAKYTQLIDDAVPKIRAEFDRQGVDLVWLFPF